MTVLLTATQLAYLSRLLHPLRPSAALVARRCSVAPATVVSARTRAYRALDVHTLDDAGRRLTELGYTWDGAGGWDYRG